MTLWNWAGGIVLVKPEDLRVLCCDSEVLLTVQDLEMSFCRALGGFFF